MTADMNPGTIRKRPRFQTDTPAQYRCFRLLTLAQMVHLEDTGPSMTGKTARQQAREALGLPNTAAGRMTPVDELIAALRDAALDATGSADAEAPTGPLKPQGDA